MNDRLLSQSAEKRLHVLFICRGSVHDGIGHVTRSRALAGIMSRTNNVKMVVIGDTYVENLLVDRGLDYLIIDNEQKAVDIFADFQPDVVIFDLMKFTEQNFEEINQTVLTVSLSPIFNCLSAVDMVFHRTAVRGNDWLESDTQVIKSDLKYAIVSEHCSRIPEKVFRHNLGLESLSMAISMGGTDAANKTLEVLSTVKRIPEKLLIWVLLGEGYAHSYQDLVDRIGGSQHEIILAKTNDSMWRILSTCSLAILAGGTTTYEAAYAGLPSINTFETERHIFLVQELLDKKVCFCAGRNFNESLRSINEIVRNLNGNRYELLKMHRRSKGLLDSSGAERIAKDIHNYLWKQRAES